MARPRRHGPHDADGRVIAVGRISTNVTELKRADANVTRKEGLLRALIDAQEHERQRL